MKMFQWDYKIKSGHISVRRQILEILSITLKQKLLIHTHKRIRIKTINLNKNVQYIQIL